MKTYALTGITGSLGRNVFFELLKNNLTKLNTLQFIIFGRPSSDQTLKERVKRIFQSEGVNYLGCSPSELLRFDSFLDTQISYINLDLSQDRIISKTDALNLRNQSIHSFYHIAADTSFRSDPNTIERLNQQNVMGTTQVLKLCKTMEIETFNYVSSAYVCGKTYGDISPNYSNIDNTFRNHYEKTKLQGELLVKAYKDSTGVKCNIFRPSTISGKLIENVKGEVCKFDVFYQWAQFFLKLKVKNFDDHINLIYTKPVTMDIRVAINFNAGLNIVPADFAAKVIYHVSNQNINGGHFHVVNNQEVNHVVYIKQMLNILNINGVTFVTEIPKDLNPLEKLFYKTVGSIFTPYAIQDQINFNTDNLQKLYVTENLHCPEMNTENFQILLEFAKLKNFGLTF